MSPDKYDRLVRRAALRALAEQEGRLRATAEQQITAAEQLEIEAADARMTADLREQGLDVARSNRSRAAAAVKQADALHDRAGAILGLKQQEKKPEEPRGPRIEDVVYTLESVVEKLSSPRQNTEIWVMAAELKAIESVSLDQRAEILQRMIHQLRGGSWTSKGGVDSSIIACIQALEAIARRYPPRVPVPSSKTSS